LPNDTELGTFTRNRLSVEMQFPGALAGGYQITREKAITDSQEFNHISARRDLRAGGTPSSGNRFLRTGGSYFRFYL